MTQSARNTSPCSVLSSQENSLNGGVPRRTRRRLQERFEENCKCNSCTLEGHSSADVYRGEKPWASFALPTLSKTLNSVQTTFDTLSQKFRRSTKRRQQLKNESSPSQSPATPQTRSRRILGRTPTKLYSPFGILESSSPCRRPALRQEEERSSSSTRNPLSRKQVDYSGSSLKSSQVTTSDMLIVGKENFDPDVEEVRVGIWELRQAARRIVQRSSLQH